ncbi:general transcription factor IIH subunit 4 [Centruroides vittatus]|uniref:general transcription factor IIH subunit 4 n=1 Tax=Centruroides vittatus TaxID=120091 RepID=UPI00350F2CA6
MCTASSKGLKCSNLHEYLRTLSQATLNRLYSHPAACLAVFRELPVMARHYIMRLLFVESTVPQAVIGGWINQHNVKKHLDAVEVLCELHLWKENPMPGGLPGWLLHSTFRKNIKTALLGGGQPWSVCTTLEEDKHARDIAFLDTYAMERWESVLHFMVGSQQSTEGISSDTRTILQLAKLMKSEESESTPTITTEGFQFLLMDTSSQIWYFMLQYLNAAEERGLNLTECLTFLFQLSFLTLGKVYSTEGMSETLLTFLQHLREIGLVYQRKRRSGRFYPTRLSLNIASGMKDANLDIHRPGFIVVETNYRVYAYTDSQLQVALLGLFCEMLYRFPNLIVGILTRDSVRQALKSGITADQIINFLRMHSHPITVNEQTSVPATVTDQIRLWEMERNRFVFKEGVLYSQFLSQSDFELLRNYARDINVLIWDNPIKRVIVVSKTGHDDVRRFWKRHRQDH